jgi:hypothetical protein
MQQNPWTADNSSVSQEIPRTLRKPKVHHREQNSLQLLHILSQINQSTYPVVFSKTPLQYYSQIYA